MKLATLDISAARRRNMQAIRGKDTGPEMSVRKALHALGHRFRLHASDLPGRPDIVFRSRRTAIEVRGCFFHRHGCANSVLPKSRTEWWQQKLGRNVARDRRNEQALAALGWKVIVVWECQVRRDFERTILNLHRELECQNSPLTRPRRMRTNEDQTGHRQSQRLTERETP